MPGLRLFNGVDDPRKLGQAADLRCRPRVGPASDEEGVCSSLRCPAQRAWVVVDDECVAGWHAEVGDQALVIDRPILESIDQVGAVEASETVAYAHAVEIACKRRRGLAGGGVEL